MSACGGMTQGRSAVYLRRGPTDERTRIPPHIGAAGSAPMFGRAPATRAGQFGHHPEIQEEEAMTTAAEGSASGTREQHHITGAELLDKVKELAHQGNI